MALPAGYSPVAIPPDKPNAALAVARAGLTVLQLDGQWCAPSAQAARVQLLLDNFDPLPDQVAALLDRVADERARRDDALLGDLPARVASLATGVGLLAKVAYLRQPLTEAERATADGLTALYGAHLAVLAAAQAIAADVAALTDPAAAFAYDIAGDSRWPSP